MSDPFLQAQVEALVQRVERLEAQMAQVMGGGAGNAESALGRDYSEGQDAREEVIGLLREGKKIHAIKAYRERTGAGLAEAKEAVERWEREYRL